MSVAVKGTSTSWSRSGAALNTLGRSRARTGLGWPPLRGWTTCAGMHGKSERRRRGRFLSRLGGAVEPGRHSGIPRARVCPGARHPHRGPPASHFLHRSQPNPRCGPRRLRDVASLPPPPHANANGHKRKESKGSKRKNRRSTRNPMIGTFRICAGAEDSRASKWAAGAGVRCRCNRACHAPRRLRASFPPIGPPAQSCVRLRASWCGAPAING
jgi:hypothetical protein